MSISSVQKPVSRRSALLPWVVCVVTVGLTVAAWVFTAREVRRTAEARFEGLTERVQNKLRQRFDTAALLLYGAAAFPNASERVTTRDWSVYLREVSVHLNNGVVGLGYAERVERSGIEALEARMRAEGEVDFKVERTGLNHWLYVVTGIEPRERNTDVLGLDIGSGNTRKTAAEMAAEHNTLTLSRRIRLNYDDKAVPGFLFFLPVYKNGVVPASTEKRLENVEGWVYAPIRIDQLMPEVVDSVAHQVDIELYEGEETRMDNLLFDADGHQKNREGGLVTEKDFAGRTLNSVHSMDIYGRRWTLRLSTRPEFDRASFSFLPPTVLGGGLVFSLLVTLLTWALVNSRSQAIKLAGDMTDDLRRLALVASHTGSGVLITDPQWRVEWINQGFTRLFGFTLPEIRGIKPSAFLAGPDSDPTVLQEMHAASENHQRFVGEILNYTKDGRKVWVELEIQPVVNSEGKLEGFMSLQLDITERKRQAEQMREAMEAAERANQAKSQFLAMMSHEIRTPMNGVIGMTSLLLDTPLNPEQRESAEIIRQSGESLLTIINDILDFSKIESGKLDIEHTEFAVADCVEGAVDVLSTPAAKKNIELLFEIANDMPALVVGDAVRLRQVLVNLLGNAIKFTQEGEVVVAVSVAGRHDSTVDLLFQVRDTGIGISAEGMDRLFKPFSQVDASMTRKFGGTGLGLAISRRLVELMGGRIAAESQLGVGSTFSFTLHLLVVADGTAVPPGVPGSLKGRRMLVVVANPTARRILAEHIETWGCVPVVTDSPKQALEHLGAAEGFDAAIIDSQLPGMDGRALGATVREMPVHAKLPLILISPHGQRENASRLFDAVLAKPVKPTHLFDAFVEIFWPSRTTAKTGLVKPQPPPPPEPDPLRVLFAAKNSGEQSELLEQLGRLKCRGDAVAGADEMIDAVRRRAYEVVMVDLSDSLAGGFELAGKIRQALPAAAETWLVGITDEAKPVDREEGRQAGINDYLARPFDDAQLSAALERAKWRLPG